MTSKQLGKILDGLAGQIQWGDLYGDGEVKDGKLIKLNVKSRLVRHYHHGDVLFRKHIGA